MPSVSVSFSVAGTKYLVSANIGWYGTWGHTSMAHIGTTRSVCHQSWGGSQANEVDTVKFICHSLHLTPWWIYIFFVPWIKLITHTGQAGAVMLSYMNIYIETKHLDCIQSGLPITTLIARFRVWRIVWFYSKQLTVADSTVESTPCWGLNLQICFPRASWTQWCYSVITAVLCLPMLAPAIG